MIGYRPSPVLPAALLLALAGCSLPVKVPEIPVLEKQDFAPARALKEPAGLDAHRSRFRCRCRFPDS